MCKSFVIILSLLLLSSLQSNQLMAADEEGSDDWLLVQKAGGGLSVNAGLIYSGSSSYKKMNNGLSGAFASIGLNGNLFQTSILFARLSAEYYRLTLPSRTGTAGEVSTNLGAVTFFPYLKLSRFYLGAGGGIGILLGSDPAHNNQVARGSFVPTTNKIRSTGPFIVGGVDVTSYMFVEGRYYYKFQESVTSGSVSYKPTNLFIISIGLNLN